MCSLIEGMLNPMVSSCFSVWEKIELTLYRPLCMRCNNRRNLISTRAWQRIAFLLLLAKNGTGLQTCSSSELERRLHKLCFDGKFEDV